MNSKTKNWIIVFLCVIIAGTISLTVYTVSTRSNTDEPNPNVTLVTTPNQTDFEVHEEWTIPETEPIDYGENLALGKPVKQSGQTDIYNGKNATDGDRFTYWEGESGDYPNDLTIDLEEVREITGIRILLNPRQIWSARTQEVELQVSTDGESFEVVLEKTEMGFDPLKDNSVYAALGAPATARYVRVLFYSNTGAKGGQAAEIEVYGQ